MSFFQTSRDHLEFKILFVAALPQVDGNFFRLDLPACWGLQSQTTGGAPVRFEVMPTFTLRSEPFAIGNDLLAGLQFHRENRSDGENDVFALRLFHPRKLPSRVNDFGRGGTSFA